MTDSRANEEQIESVEAVERLREHLLIAPRDDRAMLELAVLLEGSGDLPQAIDLCQRALRVDPYRPAAMVQLGRLWSRLGENDRARHWLERATEIDPDSEAAGILAALGTTPELTETYIRTLFDQYAPRFDENLTRDLGYRAPELVAEMLARCGVEAGTASILDLGCGTGLSGVALKRFAQRLDGVDLSPGMVGKARERALYDSLAVAEAAAFLQGAEGRWDIIAAVDVLNYIGDLTPIFAAVAARLAPAGLFVGTLEKHEGDGFVLTAKRRFAHAATHLNGAANAAKLNIDTLSEGILRTEGNTPVGGLIFAFRGP